jgi:SAM-dependent methyltransferase
MTHQELKQQWLEEEAIAHIHGWDFSHIDGRCVDIGDLPWSYEEIVQAHRRDEYKMLDIDTGGGEVLLTFGHPHENTYATEGYAPNVRLCRELFAPLGVHFKEMSDYSHMPFADDTFDLIINRHGSYDPAELYRTLKPGGLFITQQVGDDNDRELVDLLLPNTPRPFPGCNLTEQSRLFREAGFTILRGEEHFRPMRFYDTGALVWFARIIPWEFPDFSVETCFDRLLEVQHLIEQQGYAECFTHRYLLIAQK